MSLLIRLTDLSLSFPNKLCFETFNYLIHFGERIVLIGDNGCGKSSLLKIITQAINPNEGMVEYNSNISIAYVPQLRETNQLSGAEQFNQSLSKALAQTPDVLILDEPTNHLDRNNRQSLIRLLDQFPGTLIIASHDEELLRRQEYSFWHIHQQKITTFHGLFAHYQQQKSIEANGLQQEVSQLNQQKKQYHCSLMKEQKRAKSARLKGEKSIAQAKWPTIVSNAKALKAQETSGKKRKAIATQKEQLVDRLKELATAEDIKPQFDLPLSLSTNKALITINDGVIAYDKKIILKHINLNLTGQSRLAICGKNGSGKSTLIKAIMGDTSVTKTGLWMLPGLPDIGYLDQHYQQITPDKTVLEIIQSCRPNWNHSQIRNHLNAFLFRKNEQVYSNVNALSGGEKARLCLAQIAANPPKLLILDELTNNLDLSTKNHVITLLKNYPGPFIVISHDEHFLEHIDLNEIYYTDKS